ncbi:MAG: GNAT family N-acetyltransferase [Lactimicrobium sp.]|jgi:ribosomal protein S18 acetylase RimI-like enzyme|uniref:GNAT family N-acetyltransferase n=1 Tax=Lactimicrobium sp. TaxID=2563780 RepID=UPI002F352E48
MKITRAQAEEYQEVSDFYDALIDGLAGSPFDAGWKKGIYPDPAFLKASIAQGNLYLGRINGRIAAAMVLNHQWNEGYDSIKWPTDASPEDITVIHALGVHPYSAHQGLAKQMVRFAINTAREHHQKVIRLDVLKGNVPAEKLYASAGFQYLETIRMFYPDTGMTEYELYEYAV